MIDARDNDLDLRLVTPDALHYQARIDFVEFFDRDKRVKEFDTAKIEGAEE